MKLDLPQSEAIGEAELVAWLRAARPPVLSRDAAHDHYWLMHPRVRTLKNAPEGSTVFDIGAGGGGLQGFRYWLGFLRPDLQFVGASLEDTPERSKYREFFVGDIEVEKPRFAAAPDFVIASHVIEHLKDRAGFLAWLSQLLAPGSRVYIEWPSWHTQFNPRWTRMNELGFPLALNFHDDATHVAPLSVATLSGELEGAGFRIVEGGLIDMPYLADQLRDIARAEGDAYFLDLAAWLKVRFASYIVALR